MCFCRTELKNVFKLDRAESTGRGVDVEGDRVCRMIPDSIRTVSKADISDFILDFCGIFANFKIKI